MQPVSLFYKKPCSQTLLYTPTASTLEHTTPCIVDMVVHIVVLLPLVDSWRLALGNLCDFFCYCAFTCIYIYIFCYRLWHAVSCPSYYVRIEKPYNVRAFPRPSKQHPRWLPQETERWNPKKVGPFGSSFLHGVKKNSYKYKFFWLQLHIYVRPSIGVITIVITIVITCTTPIYN